MYEFIMCMLNVNNINGGFVIKYLKINYLKFIKKLVLIYLIN